MLRMTLSWARHHSLRVQLSHPFTELKKEDIDDEASIVCASPFDLNIVYAMGGRLDFQGLNPNGTTRG